MLDIIIFYIGAFFLIRIIWRFVQTVTRIFFGTKVTTERYGKDSWAVVTGCTDGIGKAIALQLAQRGFNIVLISRDISKLNQVAKQIQEEFKRETRVIVFDFGSDTSLQAYQQICHKLNDINDISILINNVGIAQLGAIDTKQPENLFQEVAINVYPGVLLTKFLIEKLEARFKKSNKRSFIANLASQAALLPNPLFANYSATKLFADFFSKGLYYELKGKGVDVLSVQPGIVSTSMNGAKPDAFKVVSAENCAKGILDKATSFMTYGGTVHEFHGFLAKSLMLDMIPNWMSLWIAEKMAKQLVIEIKSNKKI